MAVESSVSGYRRVTARARTLSVTGEVTHRHEADRYVSEPGVAVLVKRGVPRSVVFRCPDGCGDVLTINLDRRSGPAWRLYLDRSGTSLFPSVWRETGCESHFIVWRSRIIWCDADDERVDAESSELEDQVLAALTHSNQNYADVADRLGEIPWAVLAACNRLVEKGLAVRGNGRLLAHYRLR